MTRRSAASQRTREASEQARTRQSTVIGGFAEVAVRTVAPIVLALVAGGLIIWVMGVNPILFYRDILVHATAGSGWQHSLTAMAPLLLIGLGLIVAFRARLWNLGYAGGYLLAAAVVAGVAPDVMHVMPFGAGILVLCTLAVMLGAVLGVLPAYLKATRGTNEIITSLMVSFIAIGLANLLVKGPFQDAQVSVPQTRVLEIEYMLPYIPGTRVHVGVVLAFVLVLIFHVLLTKSSFGLAVDVFGSTPRAAAHVGINTVRMTVTVFILSSGLIALAGAVDMLGLWGYMRTNWNPAYGDKIIPFVFLARLNPLGSIPLIAFYAMLATGGTIAAQQAGLPIDFLLILVALILFFMVIIEYLGTRRNLGMSYLPEGLFASGRAGVRG